MEPTIRHVKLERLDPARFAPYGEVVDDQKLTFPESDPGEGRMAFELFNKDKQSLTRETIGFHFAYTQPVIVLKGRFGLLLAPSPSDPNVTLEEATVDFDRLAAFELHAGEAVMLARGVWHDFVGLEDGARVLHYTRRLTEKRGSTPAEMINMRERSNVIVQITPANGD